MTIDHALESLLRRDRWLVLAMLGAILVVSWAYLLSGAGTGLSAVETTRMGEAGDDMAGMEGMADMGGMAVTAPAAWSPGYALLMLAMWWVMMIAMMLPAATPMVLLFAAIQRRQRRDGNPHVPTALFLASYLVVWGGFSVAAVALQWSLAASGLLGSDMALGGVVGAGLLAAAGLYQLTPLKRACLRQCQNPARFLATHWRKGLAGALRMGTAHGAYCLGCCWVLMLLLFFGGVMNLYWIGGLALYMLFEKLVPPGHWLSHAAGLALLAAGVWLLAGALPQ